MTEPITLNDALPPEDGWVGMVLPLPECDPLSPDTMECLFGHLPPVEFTISGFYDDMGTP